MTYIILFLLTIVTNETVLGCLIDRESSSVRMTDILTQLTGQVDQQQMWSRKIEREREKVK